MTKKRTTKTENEASRILQTTGIEAFDEILGGGIPAKSVVLLAGRAGTGKTILAEQWLFEGCATEGEKGLYLGLTEPIDKTLRNAAQFSFYDHTIVADEDVYFTDLWTTLHDLHPANKQMLTTEDADAILGAIRDLIKKREVKRLVIDSITTLLFRLREPELIRSFMLRLIEELNQFGVVALLISEVEQRSEGYSAFGIEEFVADGIIACSQRRGEQEIVRQFQIVKMRGTSFRSGIVNFTINGDGLTIYPKMPIDRRVAKADFSVRKGSGVSYLDEMTGGGFPQGHIVLASGNTGSGKTTLAIQFLVEGANAGEAGVFVALEESVTQVKKTALQRGWDLEAWEFDDKLSFLNPSLIDLYPDRLLYNILREVDRIGATRVVVDSASSLESATLNKDQVREFLLQLSYFLKARGVTAILTYLSDAIFESQSGRLLGGNQSSDLRLSSIVDGIILMRYIEREHDVRKLINVLKMRGIDHDRGLYEFTLTDRGIEIGKRFKN